jgi:hypothetical protein
LAKSTGFAGASFAAQGAKKKQTMAMVGNFA